jgi:predicted nucleotidyltransferase
VTPERISELLRTEPAASGLRLAVLHGSRARGEAGPASDWDIGVIAADGDPELAALSAALTGFLGTDSVDVVDLGRASALLRYRAARDGVALLEARPGEFEQFQVDATQFWCDAGPVIRAAHEDVLAAL